MHRLFCRSLPIVTIIVLSLFIPRHTAIAEQTPIRIGAILHLSGDLALQGEGFREGIETAVERINTAGGVAGRPLEVIFEDSLFSPATAHRAAKKLLERDRVVAALISTFVETKTAGPLFEKARVPLICLWDSTPELEEMGEYLFSIGIWVPETGEKTARFAFNTLNARRAAVISTNREWSLKVGGDFAQVFTSAGGEVVLKEAYNPGDSDFRSLFLRLKNRGADVLYAPVDDNIATFFRQFRESKIEIPVIQSDNLNQEWISTLGPLLEGVYQSHSIEPDHPQAVKFARLYQKRYGKEPMQLLFQAWGYDGVNLLAQAITSGGPTPEKIAAELYKTNNYPGASGTITITPKGSSRVSVSIFQIENGRFVVRQ